MAREEGLEPQGRPANETGDRTWPTRPARGTSASALLVAILVVGGAGAASWDEYRPGQLSQFAPRVPADTVVLDSVRIRVHLGYFGEVRPLSAGARRHLAVWAEAMSMPEAPGAFVREVRVIEDGSEYWLPVQEVLVAPMQAELTSGDVMEAFVVFIGASAGRTRFLLNAFYAEGSYASA